MPYPPPYIAILDVGHGNSAVLRDADEIIIIDCGAKSAGLLEFLEKETITTIDKLYISHADQDHIGGLVGIISTGKFVIKEIYFNSDASKGSDLWNDLTYLLDELHESGDTKFKPGISRQEEPIKCGAINIEITGPTPYLVAKGVGGKDSKGRTINSNSLSAAFRVFWKHSSVVFLAGDIDLIGLEEILRHDGIDLVSSALVFPHHGGKAGPVDSIPFTEMLCKNVQPRTVIFSIGRNKFENPRPEIVATIRKLISDVRISCTQLSKLCMKNVAVKEIGHLADVFSRGREDQLL